MTSNQVLSHNVDIHVGERLKKKRNELGWSQTKLGKAIDVTFQQIQKYESGFNRISASKLYEIAQTLNVNINYFFCGLDKKYDETKVVNNFNVADHIIEDLLIDLNKLKILVRPNNNTSEFLKY